MPNELILICSVVFIYGAALLGYKFFGKTGLYCISVIATILANIEVTIMINAFGMEQTLGNVLFAVTFLITDILSECEAKSRTNRRICRYILFNILPCAFAKLDALYTKRNRYNYAVNKSSVLKHTTNDSCFSCCICRKPDV